MVKYTWYSFLCIPNVLLRVLTMVPRIGRVINDQQTHYNTIRQGVLVTGSTKNDTG